MPAMKLLTSTYLAFVLSLGSAIGMTTSISGAQELETKSLEEIIAGAQTERRFVWYDSITVEQANEIIAAFQEEYPDISPEFVEVPAAQRLGRVSQEIAAGGPSADLIFDTAGAGISLADQGMVRAIDWESIGPEMKSRRVLNENMILTNAPIYVNVYNTERVSAEEVPVSYEQLLESKWQGRIGTWARPNGFTGIVGTWDEDMIRNYVARLAERSPQLLRSGYAVAEAVGAGEIDLGVFLPYNTVDAALTSGAPVKLFILEPVGVVSVYGILPAKGKYPNASLLFLVWLTSPEGASIMEKATGRGNPFVPGTTTAALVEGKKLSVLSPETEIELAKGMSEFETELANTLQGR